MKRNMLLVYALISAGLILFAGAIIVKETKNWKKTGGHAKQKQTVQTTVPKNLDKTSKKESPSDAENKQQQTETKKSGNKVKQQKPPRVHKQVSEEELEAEVNDAISRYKKAATAEEKIEILEDLALISNRKILDLVYQALDDENDEVRLAAVQLLADFDSEAIVPVVDKAMNDPNEEVRLAAVEALDDIESPEVSGILAKGIADDSEDVRDAVFFLLSDKDSGTKEAILEEAIKSTYPDVREKVPDLAIDAPSHKTMELLISAMKDEDEDFREEIKSVISFFLSEDFETYEEAKDWWDKNKDLYDEELFEK